VGQTMQRNFGLGEMVNKKCIIFPDMPRNLQKVLDLQTFLSMCSGEKVKCPKKMLTAFDGDWKVPMLGASNFA
jgi:hypothetical protein